MTAVIKVFHSAQMGAPVLSNAFGDMTTVLDACLVTGYNVRTVTSITRSGNVATAMSNTHGYAVDQWLLNAGADQGAYNGELQVTAVTAHTFSWLVSGSPATPATTATTITSRTAPLDFEKVFTGTNKAVYRSRNTGGNRHFLKVDNALDAAYVNTYSKFAKVAVAQSMSDIDTFVGASAPFDPAFPNQAMGSTGTGTSAIVGWLKWYHARASSQEASGDGGSFARDWVLLGDDRGFYFYTSANLQSNLQFGGRAGYAFTDFASTKTADGFNTILMGSEHRVVVGTSSGSNSDDGNLASSSNRFDGKFILRNHTQLGDHSRAGLFALNTGNVMQVSGFTDAITFPNGPDYSLLLHPTYIREEMGAHVRGQMPGMFWVHNSGSPYGHLTVLDAVSGYPGRKFLLVASAQSNNGNLARTAFDITGPWVR